MIKRNRAIVHDDDDDDVHKPRVANHPPNVIESVMNVTVHNATNPRPNIPIDLNGLLLLLLLLPLLLTFGSDWEKVIACTNNDSKMIINNSEIIILLL